MTQLSSHPGDLFGDGMSPVRSLEPYTFTPYPKGSRKQISRGPGGATKRLSEISSTKDVRTTEDDYSTETAKMRLAKPAPAAVVVEFGEMLGCDGRGAFENDDLLLWSLWTPDGRILMTCATKQIATCYCLTGRLK